MGLSVHGRDSISSALTGGCDSSENQKTPSNSTTFCLIFTDIEGSTKLWQNDPAAMGIAAKNHHQMIRGFIAEYGAYEVKTDGDSFIIAAKDVLICVKRALAIQLELARMVPICPNLEMIKDTEGRGDPNAWIDTALRVRIGIEHCTEVTATYDSIHKRYDYYGPSMNRCGRIGSAACGGQILLSRHTYEALKGISDFHKQSCPGVLRCIDVPSLSTILDSRGLDCFVAVTDAGLASLKGISEPIHLASMVPLCFAGRHFIDNIPRALPVLQ